MQLRMSTPTIRDTIFGSKRMTLRGVIFNYEEHEILTNVMARSEKGKEFKWIYFDTTRPETHPGFWCKTRMPVHVSRHWLMLEKQNLNKHLLRHSPQPRRWLWEHDQSSFQSIVIVSCSRSSHWQEISLTRTTLCSPDWAMFLMRL